MIRRVSIFLLTLAAMVSGVNVVCQAAPQPLLTRHTRDVVASGQAVSVGHLPATQVMHFDVVLALRHQPELENFLQELYDPSSPSYKHYVTVPEFTERFGPSQEDFDAVIAFAKSSGFTVIGGSRDAFDIQLKGTVAQVEKAFNITLGSYQDPVENRTFFAPDREPSVNLPFQLWHVTGLDNYSIPRPTFVRKPAGEVKGVVPPASIGSCPQESFCGSDMRAAYYAGTALTGAGQNVGLLEYAGFDIADVNTYYTNTGQTRNFAVTGISTDGSSLKCIYPACDDTEQTIDITQAGGMAPGLTTVYVYVGNSDTAILGGMSTDTPLPLNLSSSWTWSPPDPNTDNPYFEKMAAQGQSLFQATGDGSGYKNSAPWPANSAYLTGVGGTDLVTSSAGGPWASETAWVDGGGGWGTNQPIPSWQQLAGVITAANEGSTTYRDVSDVSANANFTFYVCADQSGCTANEYGGTSFAAPMWAGYLALANQQATTNGTPAPGFINPAIYPLGLSSAYDSDFHDIVGGNDKVFPTTTGYDLPTGWGSPNGAGLINFLTGPAQPGFSLLASPSNIALAQGSSATSTITITDEGGFSGSVTLSASGLPNGVTASFNSNPASSTSTLTLLASSTAATGTVTVTISGVSGSTTGSTTISLTVNAPVQSFTLSAAPSAVSIAKGGASGTSTITVTPAGGFSGNVTLTTSALPKGVTASFSSNPATSTSVLTFTAITTAPAGTSTITITGTSGSLKATTTVTLTVTPLGGFSVKAAPNKVTVAQGSSGTSTITIDPTNGFDQAVTLSTTGVPSGVTASFSANPATTTSVLTLAVGSSTPAGTYAITVTGTFGTHVHSATVHLTVN
jgi:subtilase family serine protease